jgi:hypothetical protein
VGIARGVLKPSKMNRTEAAYATELELRRRVGEIEWWEFQAIKLRLGEDCQFCPDFFVMLKNGELECHETKGFMRDDALVKLKVAALKYPFRFYVVRKVGSGFDLEAL